MYVSIKGTRLDKPFAIATAPKKPEMVLTASKVAILGASAAGIWRIENAV
jgi:hypothetical protein